MPRALRAALSVRTPAERVKAATGQDAAFAIHALPQHPPVSHWLVISPERIPACNSAGAITIASALQAGLEGFSMRVLACDVAIIPEADCWIEAVMTVAAAAMDRIFAKASVAAARVSTSGKGRHQRQNTTLARARRQK